MDESFQVTDDADFAALESEWNELHAHDPWNSAFLSFDWVRSWWLHFGADADLFIVGSRHDGRLSGLLPLMISTQRRLGFPLRRLSGIGAGTSDYLGVIVGDDPVAATSAIARHLSLNTRRWDVLDLVDLPDEAPGTAALLAALPAVGLEATVETGHPSPFMPVDGPWDDAYEVRFSGKTRSGHRTKRRRLERLGELSVQFVVDLDVDPDALQQVFDMIERDRFHGVLRQRPFDGVEQRAFFTDVCHRFATRGWLQLALMSLDGQAIAYRLGFVCQNRHLDYFHGFADEHSKLSPGMFLLIDTLRRGFDAELDEVDFLRGAEEWKLVWADGLHQNISLTATNPTTLSRIRRVLRVPQRLRPGWLRPG